MLLLVVTVAVAVAVAAAVVLVVVVTGCCYWLLLFHMLDPVRGGVAIVVVPVFVGVPVIVATAVVVGRGVGVGVGVVGGVCSLWRCLLCLVVSLLELLLVVSGWCCCWR